MSDEMYTTEMVIGDVTGVTTFELKVLSGFVVLHNCIDGVWHSQHNELTGEAKIDLYEAQCKIVPSVDGVFSVTVLPTEV